MRATLKTNLLFTYVDSTDLTRRIDLPLTNDSNDRICFCYFHQTDPVAGVLQKMYSINPPIHSSQRSLILNCNQPNTLEEGQLFLPVFLFAGLTDLDLRILFSSFFSPFSSALGSVRKSNTKTGADIKNWSGPRLCVSS